MRSIKGKCIQYNMRLDTDNHNMRPIMNNKMNKRSNNTNITITNPNPNNNPLTSSNNKNSTPITKTILTNSTTFNHKRWTTPWCPTNHNLKIDILLNNIIILMLSKYIIIKKIKSIPKIWSIKNIVGIIGWKDMLLWSNRSTKINLNRISNTLIINNNNSHLKSNNHNNNINMKNNKNNQILMNLMTWNLREWMIQWLVISHNLKIDQF